MALVRFCEDDTWELGLDEVGLGAIAGPVVVSAVVLPPHLNHPDIRDSKKLSAKKRELMAGFIQKEALAFAVAMRDNLQVDKMNPVRAAIDAMHECVSVIQKYSENLRDKPKPALFLLIDGKNFVEYPTIKHRCVVKGDATYLSIAAASILAKVYRDQYMRWNHQYYPYYHWQNNKGYPTSQHIDAIKQYGISNLHRKKNIIIKQFINLKNRINHE